MSTPLRRISRSPHADLPIGSADVLPRLAATAWPHRAALRAGDRTVTFAEFDHDVSRLAFGLRQWLGGDGLPVVVAALPGIDFPTACHAVLRSGNVVAPINPRMPATTFAGVLEAVRPCAVMLGRAMFERVRPELAGHTGLEQVLLLDAPTFNGPLTCAELATRGSLLVEPRDRDENEPAVLAGDERLTHHDVKVRAYAAATGAGFGEGSVVLNAGPAFRVDDVCAALAAGATQVVFGHPDPAAAVREADRVGATHLCDGVRTGHFRSGGEAVAS
ncbi:MAG TPA: AMP-binding protein [Actinophytocola sp.]|uniref:AMP-binding protein n=1 Tax=Actinophytocola sp. TaxID=1872138 RepID=UPI002F92D751